MSFYEYITNQLTQRGMFNNQAKEVIENVMKNQPEMDGRWEDDINGYPPALRNLIWVTVEHEALNYIKLRCPEAWFRAIFDKEHPLRKEFESNQS